MNFYKQNKILKIKNINKNFKLRYNILGIKFTVKNRKKIEFYKQKQANLRKNIHLKLVKELSEARLPYKNENYDITCCIITYNHCSSIERAIKSILSQKTKYKYIIKIFDDCSTDSTIDICKQYALEYPDKIQYIPQPLNTKAKQASAFFPLINTKYFTILDGDDFWCNDNKLEIGLDFLENNPEYVIWAHDTLFNNEYTGNSYSYTHEHLKWKEINNPVTHKNFVYLHLSARIHRNVIDWNKEYTLNRKRDIFIYHAILDKGLMYYHDEIMSTYTFNKKGVFSKLNNIEGLYSNYYSYYTINKYLSYRQDEYFTKAIGKKLKTFKLLFGKKLGWFLYMQYLKYKTLYNLIQKQKNRIKYIEKGHKPYTLEEYNQLLKIKNNMSGDLQ